MGGGTGGHILPLLAVARSLKKFEQPSFDLVAIVDKYSDFSKPLENSADFNKIFYLSAGKFRRYPNQSILETLTDLKTFVLNIRDGFRLIKGTLEAISILRKLKPNAIFIKGGFVGVPVGFAAKLLKIPFITHDSDASPGLANRAVGKWATWHTVGMETKFYNYPVSKMTQVGIPVSDNFKTVSKKLQKVFKSQLKIPATSKLILVTGGSQGSMNLNKILTMAIKDLTKNSEYYVIHQTGKGNFNKTNIKASNYQQIEYIKDLYIYSGAADVIITRAGSVIAEFAAQNKALIVCPAPHLADNHQLKNAKILEDANAAIVLQENRLLNEPKLLEQEISNLLKSDSKCEILRNNLSNLYPKNAANDIAKIIVKVINNQEI